MTEHFDVAIVGARCAGSPLATQLARSGLRVAVVDRARFPSDTPSTHFFQAEGIASLRRLGVLDRLVATGAPFIDRVHLRVDDVVHTARWPRRPDDAGGAMAVRRPVLDTVLVEAAQSAGADLRTSTKVTGLLIDDGRVKGLRTRSGNRDREMQADLVVGADGRGSTVGNLVGARMYNVTRGERFVYWAYYEGSRVEDPAAWLQRWDDELMLGFPCDSGVFVTVVGPPLARLAEFSRDAERAFDAHVARCDSLADIVQAPGVRRIGRLRRMTNVDGYLRESAGPGWALVGDAGHFKDPSAAQGISDALRQADRLAPAIVAGLGGAQPLDEALAAWWRWRDDDASEHYWFASELGRAGGVPAVLAEGLRKVTRSAEATQTFLDVLNHRTMPSKVLTPSFISGATWRLMKAGVPPRRQVLGEILQLGAREVRRRTLNKRPAFAGPSSVVNGYSEADLTPLGEAAS